MQAISAKNLESVFGLMFDEARGEPPVQLEKQGVLDSCLERFQRLSLASACLLGTVIG
jgi:hypothetical protein